MGSPVFILSTGRTGTQFFEEYLNQTAESVVCRHEPKPSRRFKFLSNLYLDQRIASRTIARIYRRSRRSLFRQTGERQYVESSNFLFGCIPAISQLYQEPGVVHIIRHPVGYVKSHLGHGFWKGHKKFFARHVPYWMERVEISDRTNPAAWLSARWNYVNRQIASYATTNPYLLVRFEDLFSKDSAASSAQINSIRTFCGLDPLSDSENTGWLRQPKNYSKIQQELSPGDTALILRETETIRTQYGYNE